MSGLIGQRLGQYEITALLGKGGMATVYRATQTSMGRDVAIKVIKPDLAEVGDFVTRFEREARTVASLSHPYILKVFDYGHEGDLVYLVMELLKGGSLAEQIRRGALSPAETLRAVEQIASALDYAHELGIIHRDLKPQNVLLDGKGNAHLTDFGIAKILSATVALTQSGTAMGTPAYMSPEQWQGLPLDARADIYALGVMLFEMLSGRLPFDAETPFSMMHMHVSQPPPSIRDVRADLPPAVEQVISKALAKNRDERYASAGDLVEALRAALAGRAIPVHPAGTGTGAVSPPTQAAKPAAQAATIIESLPDTPRTGNRPLLIGVGVVVAALIVVGGAFAILSGTRGSTPSPSPSALPATNTQVAALVTQTSASSLTPTALIATPTSAPTTRVAPANPATSTSVPTATLDVEATTNAKVNATLTALAAVTKTAAPTITARATLAPSRPTAQSPGFQTAVALVPAPNRTSIPATSAPGGATAQSPGFQTAVALVPAPNRTSSPATSAPEGATAQSPGFQTAVALVPAPNRTTIPATSAPGGATAQSPGSQTAVAVAPAANTITLANAGTVKALATLQGHTDRVLSVAYSPDGSLIASGGGNEDPVIRLWDAKSGAQRGTLKGHDYGVASVKFSPDGTMLASGSYDGTARLWDVKSGQTTFDLHDHADSVLGVAFSPDGTLLATASVDATVRLWDVKTGQTLAVLRGHPGGATGVAFSPDGSLLAVSAEDVVVRVWDVKTAKIKLNLRGHTKGTTSVAFSPDGSLLASGSQDETVRLWNLATGKPGLVIKGHESAPSSLAFSPDGSLLASGSWDTTLRLWDVKTGAQQGLMEGHTAEVYGIVFSPDGSRLVSASVDKTIRIWGIP